MSPELKRRIARVNREIRMGDLMERLGYRVRDTPHEQQFACDLHGPDRKPSARLYPNTNSTYCWVCHKARRPVHLIMERESVGLTQAVSLLEDMYHLPILPVVMEEEPDFDLDTPTEDLGVEDELHRLDCHLRTLTRERSCPMSVALWAWEKFDLISHLYTHKELDIQSTLRALEGIREKMSSHDGRTPDRRSA